MNEAERLLVIISDFYGTSSEFSRREMGAILENFRQSRGSWRTAIAIIDDSRPINVQFFGAETLYFVISKNFEEILENVENTNVLKAFLLQKLTTSAHSLAHSVLNKLSSGLALFILKCIPDIWMDPIGDLQKIWFGQMELLLRVLVEISAEFHRLNVALDHRQSIRAQLQRTTPQIVQMAQQVLEDKNSPCSLRNAAIECVEGWLKLPGINLLDFVSVFDAVFQNIGGDFLSLTRVIDTIKSNDELCKLPQLVWQLTRAIVTFVCPLVLFELDALQKEMGMERRREGAEQEMLMSEKMEELAPLIFTVVEFSAEFVAKIVVDFLCKNPGDATVAEVYTNLCGFFFQISTLPGLYPVQECVSDLPEPWWYALREELLLLGQEADGGGFRSRLKADSVNLYIGMLQSAASTKVAYLPALKLLDKEAQAKFEQYRRVARSDCCPNAIQIAPGQTVELLASNLAASLDPFDAFRTEAIFHLITEAADFLQASQFEVFLPSIFKCGKLVEQWEMGRRREVEAAANEEIFVHLASTFMRFVRAVEHLLMSCSEAEHVLKTIVQAILFYLRVPELSRQSLETLLVILKKRTSGVDATVDDIISGCYNYFAVENNPPELRILAMRSLGTGLSFKNHETIIKSLGQIIFPWLSGIQGLANQAASSSEQWVERMNFELSVLASLVATLEAENNKDDDGVEKQQQQNKELSSGECETPVKLILVQCLPIFNKLLTTSYNSPKQQSEKIIGKISSVLEAGIHSLYTGVVPLLANYLHFIDATIASNPEQVCELAKRLFLTFHKKSPVETPLLVEHLASWFIARSSVILNNKQQQNVVVVGFPSVLDEKLVELANYVFKKFWDCLLFAAETEGGETVSRFIQSAFCILTECIERSRDVSLTHDSLRTLGLFLKNFAQTENSNSRSTIAQSVEVVAERTISVVFLSAQNESMLSTNVNQIADILYMFASKYPTQTRMMIQRLCGGDSPIVSAMFASHSQRNYRLRMMQIHQNGALVNRS